MGGSDHDLDRVRQAIALGAAGRFSVEPNPLVGCVLERDGRVVGEGWHLAYGGPHAEIVALEKARGEARGATAYVSLEPCSRVLKTGACTVALARAGVRRVVYAVRDPNMAEEGLEGLRRAGIDVEGPVLEDEGAPLLEPFLRARALERPWVVLKWAMSLDGRIAPARGRSGRISGDEARTFVHDLRAHCDAVAVGVETVCVDDPRLTCRLEGGLPHGRGQPRRVVFDTGLRTPVAVRLVEDAPEVPVLFVCARDDPVRRSALEARGAEIVVVPAAEGGVDLVGALEALYARGVRRLLVEGGARIHGALLAAGLADQVAVIVAPFVLGGSGAPAAVTGTQVADMEGALCLEHVARRCLGDDLLVQGYVAGYGRTGTSRLRSTGGGG